MAAANAESTAWNTREWTGGFYHYSTSDRCLSHPRGNLAKCYDPSTNEVHECTEVKCPHAYELEAKKAEKEKAKQKKLF